MDNRRLLLAVLLSWIVVVLWSVTFGPKPGDSPPPAPAGETAAEAAEGSRGTAAGERSAVERGEAEAGGEEGPEASVTETPEEPVEAGFETTIPIETPAFTAVFTNRGAKLVSFRLKDHLDDENEPFELVRQRDTGPLPFALVGRGGEGLPVNDALFSHRLSEEPGSPGGPVVQILDFEYRGSAGSVRKRFAVQENGLVDLAIENRRQKGGGWGVFLGPGVGNPDETQLEQAQYWRGAVYLSGDDRETEDARKLKEPKFFSPGSVRWVALDEQYFVAAVIPGPGLRELELRPYLMGLPESEVPHPRPLPPKDELTDEEKKEVRSLALILHAGSDSLEATSYWGAKAYDELAALPYGLTEAVDYGWFSFLARPLQIGLNLIFDRVVSNYGWAIVLMTILIRLLMLPLTYQSMRSSQKMQQLNPKVQAVRARYRGKLKDKQGRPNVEVQRKMQDEIMKIYRSEGVNPVSGCLPMVFQIPVFFAFYQLLGKAIELRHAPWIGWIEDLSVMDPYYVLPIVMFVTQFIQQYRMPMGADPMQRRLFLLMPFLFLFLFLKFPAGLVLYWLTNNVFTILQQEGYKLLKERGSSTESDESTVVRPSKKGSVKA